MIRLSPGYERTTKTNSILIWMIYPAYSIYWIARYAGEQSTWRRKIGMFTAFLPILGARQRVVGISCLRHPGNVLFRS
jgi:hypothetical protein